MRRHIPLIKRILKSKTIVFNCIIAVLAAIELNVHLLQDYLGHYYGVFFICITCANIVLRFVTSTPILQKKEKDITHV